MTKLHRRSFASLLACTLAFSGAAAWAQSGYPAKPIRIVVPYAAGGPVDVTARIMAERLETHLGQRVLVDNKGGGNATIGTEFVARAAPDGYTLLMAAPAHTANPSLIKSISFDTAKDFAPISMVMDQPMLIAVQASVPANNIKELVALLKANPTKFNYGTSGAGGPQHLMGELFKAATGTQIAHIPYRGAAPAAAALLAGDTQVAFSTPTNILPYVKSGKLRALASSTAGRSPFSPDLPTLAEAGVAGFEYSSWTGLLAPAGTPREVIQKIFEAVSKSLAEKETRDKMMQNGIQPVGSSPDDFARFIALDMARSAKIIKDSGIQPE
jgi:tripartite-type tricarboxylate transporter receptor subunit TctC